MNQSNAVRTILGISLCVISDISTVQAAPTLADFILRQRDASIIIGSESQRLAAPGTPAVMPAVHNAVFFGRSGK